MEINAESLSAITRNFNFSYLDVFNNTIRYWDRVATMTSSTSTYTTYPKVPHYSFISEWTGERKIQSTGFDSFNVLNKKYESTIAVARDAIEDDNIGIYAAQVRQLGMSTAQHADELIFRLMKESFTLVGHDGQYFIDSDHPIEDAKSKKTISVSNYGGGDTSNPPWFAVDTMQMVKPYIFQQRKPFTFSSLTDMNNSTVFMNDTFYYGVMGRCAASFGEWQFIYGSHEEINEASLNKAFVAMQSMRRPNGESITLRPNLIVVSPENELAAKKLVLNTYGPGGESNVFQGSYQLEVLSIPHLSP